MNLSHKLTFSLVCFVVLLAFTALPAMAQTISAEWVDDYDADAAGDQQGWNVTLAGLAAGDTVTVTYLDRAGTASAATGTQAGFAAVPDPGTETEGQIAAGIGVAISVQVAKTTGGDTTTYQRVDFPAGGPNAPAVTATDLKLRPKLMDLAVSQYYLRYNQQVTVTFNFAEAVADTNDDAVAMLHISDVELAEGSPGASLERVSVSGTNMVTFRSTLGQAGPSGTTTVRLHGDGADGNFALQATTPADGHAMVTYDNMAPTITPTPGIVVAAPPGSPTPPNGIWGGAYPVFNVTFSVADEDNGSGLPDTNPVRIDTDRTKLMVGPVGLGTQDDTVAGTEYLVQITPRADRVTADGEAVVITIVPMDNAGNEGMGSVSVKLAEVLAPPPTPATIANANLGSTTAGATLTITFSKDPGTVSDGTNTLAGTGTTRMLMVPATAAPGSHSVALTWTGTDAGTSDNGSGTVTYSIPQPVTPPSAATITTTALGDTTAGATLTITFSKDPGTVMAGGNTLDGTGTTRTFTAAATTGSHSLALTWTGTDARTSDDGSGTVTYNIPDPNPTSPSNIMMVMIPANSYVVLVRDAAMRTEGQGFPDVPPVNGTPVNVMEWSGMPDLHDLFLRSAQNRGGALVVRKSAFANDNAAPYADPGVGTVGISEIMSGRDLGMGTAADQAAGQWIELHNLNSAAVKVLIYAQKGADGLVSGGLLQNTAAGDSLLGNNSGMVLDAIQNIRNDGNQAAGGWDVKSKDGNSVTGDHFASMHRILPHNQPSYANADHRRYNNRKGTNGGHWAQSGSPYLRGQTTHTSGGVTNVPILFDYRGTPGDVNNRTGIAIHTPAGRTNVPSNSVIFNEVANYTDTEYEWIELRNLTGGDINLRNYLISIVTDNTSDDTFYQFPNNNNAVIPANGVFLLVASDPRDDHNQPSEHPLAIGYNVDKNPEDQIRGLGDNPPRYKVVRFATPNDAIVGLPNDGKFVLMLRKPDGHQGHRSGAGPHNQGVAETGQADLDKVVDVAGWDDNVGKSQYPNPVSNTGLWPLYSFGGPFTNRNAFWVNTVHRRQFVTTNDGRSGIGAHENKNQDDRAAWRDIGYTGVGYKRQAAKNSVNGGTPGYHGIEQGRTAGGAELIISEIMLTQGTGTGRQRLPQWIEIYNPTNKAVSLAADAGWRLVIEEERIALRTINFKTKGSVQWVQPGQTILVVSSSARDLGHDYLPASVVFPVTRVYNVYQHQAGDFGMTSRYDPFLNMNSFNIRLIDGQGKVSDEIGNLDGNVRTSDVAKWEFTQNAITKDGLRTSYIRVFDSNVARNGLSIDESNVLPLGAVQADDMVNLGRHQIPMKYAWVRASQADLGEINIRHIWYGDEEDFGTPLYREGAILPVELSSFRPTSENGKVTIQWITESELDNAGFNILRSDTRNGEFKQVNEHMIQGKGTTAERTTYKWVDTTAKPGAVYYYQIEDVSLAGERTTLAVTKLKGLISAKGKATTRWGELKNLR